MNWLTSRCAPLVALATLALASCDKGTDLNVDLPDTTAVNTEYQDFPVDVATVRFAPVQTQKTDHYLIGRLVDNVAGTTEARAYFNVITASSNDSLPSKLITPVLDSVVLVMGYDKVNGSTGTPVKFDVYNLQASLDERQSYNSSSVTATGPTALGSNLVGRLDHTLQVATDTTTRPITTATVIDPVVRLALYRAAATTAPLAPSPAVASPFFSNTFFTALRGTSFTQAQLDGLLKGLAIVPSPGYSSAIVSFGRAYNARLAFFFHDDGVPAPAAPKRRTWHSYSIFFGPVYSGAGAASASDPRYYTQIISTLPPALAALNTNAGSIDPNLLNGIAYVQEGTGFGARVTFRGLSVLMNQPRLTVNRAELRAPVKPYTNALFPNPGLLYAVEVGPNNDILQRIVNYTSYDRIVQADGQDQLGTSYPATSALTDAATTQSYYSIPITSYLDAYLKDKLDGDPTALVLVPNVRNSASLSLNRAALDAAHISLRVYYSKR
ncbi:DUF4270 family protein [Hymenobacter terricola]|uniref:DUF4270 family protein n=1 Tax=Hymenobacter terricola TaxID=2819236 RepID=UPI001B30C3DF|nr:DUF4270 family protein [Hymenobacter terricola]